MGYRYFTEEELSCNCGCGKADMNEEFMNKVEAIREELGFLFIVSSAYRCSEYNNEVSSTGYDGPHTTGQAMDILVSYEQAYFLAKKAFEESFTGIGINQKGNEGRFIHLDNLQEGRPRVWSY